LSYDGVHLWQAGQNVYVDSPMAMLNIWVIPWQRHNDRLPQAAQRRHPRGAVWDCDLPAAPGIIDDGNEAAELSAFFQLLDEVLAEQGGETRALVLREVAEMKREHGIAAGSSPGQSRG
jgi:hypothetical protein